MPVGFYGSGAQSETLAFRIFYEANKVQASTAGKLPATVMLDLGSVFVIVIFYISDIFKSAILVPHLPESVKLQQLIDVLHRKFYPPAERLNLLVIPTYFHYPPTSSIALYLSTLPR